MNTFNPFKKTFEECRLYTKEYAKSFYFSSFMLPKRKRYASYAVYAFCRYADNIVDLFSGTDTNEVNIQLEELKNDLDKAYDGKIICPRGECAFTETVRKYQIPKIYFLELMDGVMMDNTKKRIMNEMELDNYCYKVASVIGIIMCHIFGYAEEDAFPYAVAMGKAMQLTNILRDIREDYEMGRVYIPQTSLKKFNYSEEDLKNCVINENFISLMKYYIEEARCEYEIGKDGMPYLSNDGSRTTAQLMMKTYAGILDKIEMNNYDIFSRRVYVKTSEKISVYFKNFFEPQRELVPEVIIF